MNNDTNIKRGKPQPFNLSDDTARVSCSNSAKPKAEAAQNLLSDKLILRPLEE